MSHTTTPSYKLVIDGQQNADGLSYRTARMLADQAMLYHVQLGISVVEIVFDKAVPADAFLA